MLLNDDTEILIGTDPTGSSKLANDSGVSIGGGASGNTVGGTAAGARNVISGNGFAVGIGGTGTTGSDDLKMKLATSMLAANAIGILSTDVAQESRPILSVLAYQHFGQTCGYYPDREITSNEKQNVRDGHYAIWGPLHLFTVLNNMGYPLKPVVADIIGFMTGTKAPPLGLDLIALEAQRHVVPQCAMRVKRTEEMGPLASFAPD